MNRALKTGATVLSGVGALNWGLTKFVNMDLLTYLPAGIFNTVAVAVIAASGAYVLYAVFKKEI